MKFPLIIELFEALIGVTAGVLIIALFRAWHRKKRAQL
jgi:hypothetical protein